MTLFVERRRPRVSTDMLVRVSIAWMMIGAVLLVTNLPSILSREFPDPDDVLRLVQVRDLLAGQNWFDLTQHRIDAPGGGVPMHWSRLVDLPIAALILMLTPLFGSAAAETAALVAVPLLTFLCALMLAGRIAWRLIGEEATGLACFAMALSVPVIAQMRPLRIDHHGWQIVAVLLVMNGLMARDARRGGWLAGGAMAAWLAISIEGLPLAAAICGVVALKWLRERRGADWFVHLMQGLAVGSALLFAGTRGFDALVTRCDAISPLHLAIFALGAGGAMVLRALEPLPKTVLVGGLALIGAFAVVLLAMAAPQCLLGGFGTLDPLVETFWYREVGEGMPVWQQTPALALQIVVPPLVGILAALQLAGRSSDWLRRWWYDYAMILAAALVIALFVARAGGVAGALAAVPLGWQLREWLRAARHMRRPGKRALAMAGMALALVPALPLTLLSFAVPVQAANIAPSQSVRSCGLREKSAFLRRLPRGEILAPLDLGPHLLLDTGHSVVATGHHRAGPAIRQDIEAFIRPPAHARAMTRLRGTTYILVCRDQGAPERYAAAGRGSLMARLLAGDAPDWLVPIEVPGAGDELLLWRVDPV